MQKAPGAGHPFRFLLFDMENGPICRWFNCLLVLWPFHGKMVVYQRVIFWENDQIRAPFCYVSENAVFFCNYIICDHLFCRLWMRSFVSYSIQAINPHEADQELKRPPNFEEQNEFKKTRCFQRLMFLGWLLFRIVEARNLNQRWNHKPAGLPNAWKNRSEKMERKLYIHKRRM